MADPDIRRHAVDMVVDEVVSRVTSTAFYDGSDALTEDRKAHFDFASVSSELQGEYPRNGGRHVSWATLESLSVGCTTRVGLIPLPARIRVPLTHSSEVALAARCLSLSLSWSLRWMEGWLALS
jgi:hypothetical protein